MYFTPLSPDMHVISWFPSLCVQIQLKHHYTSGAVKADPGMPSSHAVSLSFLSVYAAAVLVLHGGGAAVGAGGGIIPQWVVLPGAGLLVAAGVFLAWLRVELVGLALFTTLFCSQNTNYDS